MTALHERLLALLSSELAGPAHEFEHNLSVISVAAVRREIEAAQALQAAPEGGGVDHYSISWADYWIGQGNFPLANDF